MLVWVGTPLRSPNGGDPVPDTSKPGADGLGRKQARRRVAAILAGLAAAALFVAISSINLGAQGLYQDEILQATGSFAYVGGEPVGALAVKGIPLMNNPYLGAIKTGLYGIWLRASGRGFSAVSWRMLGILMVAIGILAFPLLSRPLLPVWAALLCLACAVTDGTIILATRHDWGPVALALLIRLLLIGLLLREHRNERGVARGNLLIGLLFGLAVFEKLSSVVLLAPIAICLALEPARRRLRPLRALALGVFAGSLPLIAVNCLSYAGSRTFISLREVTRVPKPSPAEFVRTFPQTFLSLGAGNDVREMILGQRTAAGDVNREMALAAALLIVTLAVAFWKFRQGAEFRAAATLGVSFFGVALCLHLLPRWTTIHHNIQVLPFHYAAAAVALAGLVRLRPAWRAAEYVGACVLTGVSLLMVAQHVVTIRKIAADLVAGRASAAWDPAYTAIGNFADSKRTEAVFLVAEWGVGAPIYCLTQGRPGVRHEVFWNYGGPPELERIARESGRKTVYLVTPLTFQIAPRAAERINRDAGAMPGWREVPPEPEAAALRKAILVRKFVL